MDPVATSRTTRPDLFCVAPCKLSFEIISELLKGMGWVPALHSVLRAGVFRNVSAPYARSGYATARWLAEAAPGLDGAALLTAGELCRRDHMPTHAVSPYRHYMTSTRLRHRPIKSAVEQLNSGIAAQLATRERHRIDQF